MLKLNELTIKKASEKLKNKEISSVELTQACLEQIKKTNPKINAFITICEEQALKDAKIADQKISNGETGALLGIPYMAKDVIMTKNTKTTAASKILENYTAPFDATVIKKLKQAGAILLGKGNCDEFGHGASGENSAFGNTTNPWDTTRVAGGSSSGPAAAVAANMCIFSIGTDTGGSLRCPAGFCGVTGLKATYGRNSRFGLLSMTSSTDTPGPLTKTIEDAAILMKIMAGKDKNDATSVVKEVPNYSKDLNNFFTKDGKKDYSFNQFNKNPKIGIPEDLLKEGIDEGVKTIFKQALKKLKDLGAELIPIRLPHAKYGIPVYYIITPSEISSNLARFDGIKYGLTLAQNKEIQNLLEVYQKSRGKGFGAETKRRIMLGTYVLSAGYYDEYYIQAQKVRTKIKKELDNELKNLDAIITPTQPDTAFKIGEQNNDPLKMYLEDIFVAPASLAGLPAVSIPCGFSDNLPVGMQLIGKRFEEMTLLKIGQVYQKNTNWHETFAKIN